MSVNAPTTPNPAHAAGSSSAASALALARRTAAHTGDDGNAAAAAFATQLRNARDDAQDAKDAADSRDAAEAKKDASSHDDAAADDATSAADGSKPATTAHRVAPDAPPPQAAWTVTLNPALAELAKRATGTAGDANDLLAAAGRLSARLAQGKAAANGLAALDDLKGAALKAGADLKGALGAAEAKAGGLGAADSGAANAATGTKDSLAALLPGADDAMLAATAAASAGAADPTTNLANDAALANAAGAAPAQATLDMPPQSPGFAPALGKQIEVWMKDGVQHAEVQLNPLELGPIRVRIAIEGDQTRVEMAADVQSTRDALQQAVPQLADALGQVGLSLGGAGVSDQPASRQQAGEGAFSEFAEGARRGATGVSRGDAAALGTDAAALATTARTTARRGLLDAYA